MTLAETLIANSCSLLLEQTSEIEIKSLQKDLPSDVHLVVTDQGVYGIRAAKASEIFDAFHDEGHKVAEIKSGYGCINPKLFKEG